MIFSLTILAFIFVVGLVTGSFLNVVILRTVSKESIITPGSKCPKCQTPLKWYHNIPVISYIFLKGKCAFCNEKISIQYPIVELLTGIIYVWMFIKFCKPFDAYFGLDVMNPINIVQIITYMFVLIACSIFIVIAVTDLIEMKVADKHTYSLIGSGIIYSIIMSVLTLIYYTKQFGKPNIDWAFFLTCPILYALAGTIVAFVLMEMLRRISSFILKIECFGEGDSYIAAGIGSVIGGLFGISPLVTNFLPIFLIIAAIFLLSALISVVFSLPIYIKSLISTRNTFVLYTLIAFAVYALGYVFAREFGLLENHIALYASTIVLILLGLLLCGEILRGIKEHKSESLAIPFGPALVSSAFIAIAFMIV